MMMMCNASFNHAMSPSLSAIHNKNNASSSFLSAIYIPQDPRPIVRGKHKPSLPINRHLDFCNGIFIPFLLFLIIFSSRIDARYFDCARRKAAR